MKSKMVKTKKQTGDNWGQTTFFIFTDILFAREDRWKIWIINLSRHHVGITVKDFAAIFIVTHDLDPWLVQQNGAAMV